jgi:hypothetical protein
MTIATLTWPEAAVVIACLIAVAFILRGGFR